MSRDNFPMFDTKRNSPDSSPRPQTGSGPSATVRQGLPAVHEQVTKPVPAGHHKHKGHANGPASGPAPHERSPNPSLSDHSVR